MTDLVICKIVKPIINYPNVIDLQLEISVVSNITFSSIKAISSIRFQALNFYDLSSVGIFRDIQYVCN